MNEICRFLLNLNLCIFVYACNTYNAQNICDSYDIYDVDDPCDTYRYLHIMYNYSG